MPGTASLRTRWAAIGAAVAVTLGGGLTLAAQAVTDPTPTAGNTYTPISPCRLMDTRSGSSNVGDRNTPIQGGTFYEATVHGTNGNCTISPNATGIATNTTVVNGTTASFLTLYPADVTRPLASNLNWTAGQAATPNQVTVGLSQDGKIRIYNDRGTVNVIIDIVGIYTDPTTTLDARYLTKATADGRYYSKAEHDGLPSSALTVHGSVTFLGTKDTFRSSAGDFTVSKGDTGTYDLTFPGLWPACTVLYYPTLHLTTGLAGRAGVSAQSLGACVDGRRDVFVQVQTVSANGDDVDLSFHFLLVFAVPD